MGGNYRIDHLIHATSGCPLISQDAQLHKCKLEIADLTARLAAAEDALSGLQQRLRDLTRSNEDLTSQIGKRTQAHSALEEQLVQARAAIRAATIRAESAAASTAAAKTECESLAGRHQRETELLLSKHAGAIAAVRDECALADRRATAANAQAAEEKEKHFQTQRQLQELTSKFAVLEQARAAAEQRQRDIADQLAALQAQLNESRSAHATTSAEASATAARLARAEAAAQEQRVQSEQAIAQLRGMLSDKDAVMATVAAEHAAVVQRLESAAAEKDLAVRELETRLALLSDELSGQSRAVRDGLDALAVKTAERDTAQAELNTARQQLAALQAELRSTIESSQRSISEHTRRIEVVEGQLRQREAESAKMQDEVRVLLLKQCFTIV